MPMSKMFLFGSVLATTVLGGAAQAADLPRKALPPPAPPLFTWTGFYIGAHVGAGWGTKEWHDFADVDRSEIDLFPGPQGSYNVNGFLGGGQIGFNWQSGWWVFGIEADASGANLRGSGFCFFDFDGGDLHTCNTKVTALGTITGRLGFTVIDRAMIYVKGGGA